MKQIDNFLSWLKRIFHAQPSADVKSTPLEYVDFSLRKEVNTGDINNLGPQVLLVRTRADGIVERDFMSVIEANYLLLNDVDNGTVYVSGRIEYIHVWSGDWDQSA
jgi:hypothetical protein